MTNCMLHKALYSARNDHNYFEIAHTIKYVSDMTGDRLNLYTFVDNHDVERIYTKLKTRRISFRYTCCSIRCRGSRPFTTAPNSASRNFKRPSLKNERKRAGHRLYAGHDAGKYPPRLPVELGQKFSLKNGHPRPKGPSAIFVEGPFCCQTAGEGKESPCAIRKNLLK